MPRKRSVEINLGPVDLMLLGKWRRTSWDVGLSLRADIVMRAANGQTNYRIAKELGISRNTVKLWRYRFAREGMAGLKTRPIPGRPPRRVSVPQAGDIS